jgi:pimeloyl-ACP methyl ester carboxylesterase
VTDALAEQLGSSLGPAFTLGGELATGGMSRVYRARDTRLERDIVVKVLSPELAEQLSVERFEREIRFAAGLQEPHIVPVLDAGMTAGGLPWFTMPFVTGESLRARLARGGALSAREGIAILRDVALALAYAHARGIVHRDIKPENILLSGDTAVVADFGIAKAISAAGRPTSLSALTAHGLVMGTPAYMSPEQIAADPSIDHRADIYAWGVVAYELLSGRHPFADRLSHQAMVTAHLSEVPVNLAALRPELPAPVSALVMRCLEKNPSHRPGDAAELLATLDATAAWPDAPPRRRITERAFRLTEAVCRRLDRTMIDPRMIGDSMRYLENDAPAGVLVFCMHGMGHEAMQLAPMMIESAHRVIAPTLYGFEDQANHARVPLPIEAHLALLRELLADAIARLSPSRVVLAGFSSGADLALRMLADATVDLPRIDACVAVGANLALETCFGSRVFARLQAGEPSTVLADVRSFGNDATDFDEWLNLMAYELHVLRKFRGDLAPLSTFAAGIVRPFEESDDAFASWYRAASARVRVLRCVFESSSKCTALVYALRLRNLDGRVLGPHYEESSLVLDGSADHQALIERMPHYIEETVAMLT